MLRNIKQLQGMVGDLLESARADSGKLTLEPQAIGLRLLVAESLTMLSTSAAAKRLKLSTDIPRDLPIIFADPRRVNQILTNLITNALKFTPENGSIQVRAGVFATDPNFVRVSVVDTGCGISPASAKKIFDRLYQEERTVDTNRKKLGLGLYICKQLVSNQGGRIWVESELGKGTSFHFTLPVFSPSVFLRPIFDHPTRMKTFAALISVEVDPLNPMGEATRADFDKLGSRLQKLKLPERTVLMPRIASTGKRAQFYLVSGTDLDRSNEIAARIAKEIAGGNEEQQRKYRVETSVNMVGLPSKEGRVSMEILANVISHRIASSMRQAEKQEESADPLQIKLSALAQARSSDHGVTQGVSL